jgi:hypothetical protein
VARLEGVPTLITNYYLPHLLPFLFSPLLSTGEISAFTDKGAITAPTGIVMYHKEKCYFVTAYNEHKIKKITEDGKCMCF